MKKINYDDLPGEIKSIIYKINRDKDKHEKLLNRCFKEIAEINNNVIQYMDWVVDCVGISLWEHYDDFEYLINLEYSREKEKREYYRKMKKICNILIKNLNISINN